MLVFYGAQTHTHTHTHIHICTWSRAAGPNPLFSLVKACPCASGFLFSLARCASDLRPPWNLGSPTLPNPYKLKTTWSLKVSLNLSLSLSVAGTRRIVGDLSRFPFFAVENGWGRRRSCRLGDTSRTIPLPVDRRVSDCTGLILMKGNLKRRWNGSRRIHILCMCVKVCCDWHSRSYKTWRAPRLIYPTKWINFFT